jgi:hypothetical protein
VNYVSKIRTVMAGGMLALVLAGCAHGNAATVPTTPTTPNGGNFMQFYVQQLQQPPTNDPCPGMTVEQLLAPRDEETRR